MLCKNWIMNIVLVVVMIHGLQTSMATIVSTKSALGAETPASYWQERKPEGYRKKQGFALPFRNAPLHHDKGCSTLFEATETERELTEYPVDYLGSCRSWCKRMNETVLTVASETNQLLIATHTSSQPPYMIAVTPGEEDERIFAISHNKQYMETGLTTAISLALSRLLVPSVLSPVVFIDVGCNAGVASLYALQFGVERSICVEPNTRLLSRLRYSRLLNAGSVDVQRFHVVSAAAWSSTSQVYLHWQRYGMAVINDEACGQTNDNCERVLSTRLDNILLEENSPLKSLLLDEKGQCISRLAVKVDVEGSEYHTLLGMAKILHCVEWLYLELSPENRLQEISHKRTSDTLKLLNEHGLQVSGFEKEKLRKYFHLESIEEATIQASLNQHRRLYPLDIKTMIMSNAVFLRSDYVATPKG